MKKHVLPSVLILLFLGIAVISLYAYISKHPISLMRESEQKTDGERIAIRAGEGTSVVRVVDGDTIDVLIEGKKTPVRFIGVNAPETYQGKKAECFAEESFEYVKNRIEGKHVSLVADDTQENKDIYERLLRYIFLDDGTNLNLELIQKGYAREYTYKIPYQQQQEFRNAQIVAKASAIGLWKECY